MGVREAKKQQTRQMLSEIATGLFAARGFDQVTVAEIAATAGVSKMTVFNYFPRKEDLLFDRQAEAQRLLEEALHDRQPGQAPVAALRRLALALLAQRHPLSGLRDGSEWFWKIVEASPSLVSRMREVRRSWSGRWRTPWPRRQHRLTLTAPMRCATRSRRHRSSRSSGWRTGRPSGGCGPASHQSRSTPISSCG